jgi:hypothetical protein
MPSSDLRFIVEQLAPIPVFAIVAWLVKAWMDTRVRGKLAASNSSQELIRAILSGDEESRRLAPLRWGIVLTCLAAGLAMIEVMGAREPTAGVFAILLAATGLGNLGFFAVAKWLRSRSPDRRPGEWCGAAPTRPEGG